MKCLSLHCTRQQYAVVLAWCRQSEITPCDMVTEYIDMPSMNGPSTEVAGYSYKPLDLDKLIEWYGSSPGSTKVGFNIYMDETEYMLAAIRWPEHHLRV